MNDVLTTDPVGDIRRRHAAGDHYAELGQAAIGELLTEIDRLLRVEKNLRASYDKLSGEHCRDCCCARSWKALRVTEYTGKSIPEHIEGLRSTLERYMFAYPAFRMKPVGEPGSPVRIESERLMALEEQARRVLSGGTP